MNTNISDANVKAGLASLRLIHRGDWLRFSKMIRAVAEEAGLGAHHDTATDFEPTLDDCVNAGLDADQGAALLFVMTQEVFGRACDNQDDIDRWFVIHK